MKNILVIAILLAFYNLSFAQENTATEPESEFKEELLLNKWWVSNPNKNNGKNGLKQYYRNLGKFKTIGTNTGSWGWRNKNEGIMYVDYVGQKWLQKIIKLTETEFVYERDGKTFYLKSN